MNAEQIASSMMTLKSLAKSVQEGGWVEVPEGFIKDVTDALESMSSVISRPLTEKALTDILSRMLDEKVVKRLDVVEQQLTSLLNVKEED